MRYSGYSLAYQFAAILGGMAPLVCTALVAATGSVHSVAAFLIVLAMVSFGCSYLMTETLRSGLRSNNILSPPLKVKVPARFPLPSDIVCNAAADIYRR
jgi:hypothetical protein